MTLRGLMLATTFIVMPVMAHAEPISAFFVALAGGSATTAAVAAAIGGATAFAYTAGTFFATTLGSLLLSVGLNLAEAALNRKARATATIADAQVNFRNETAVRMQLGGTVAVGGSLGTFAEHSDVDGSFWYIVVHGDSELTGTPSYILDGIPVTLAAEGSGFTAGDVISDQFCLTPSGAAYNGIGARIPVFRLYTVTPASEIVFGTLPAAFVAAFPTLPSDFRLTGVCFTLVRVAALDPTRRANAMHWRGAFGLGEPSVVMVGNFSRMYDPRNPAHVFGDGRTYTPSNGNTAIVWAWWRTTVYGRNRPITEVSWAQVAAMANICDQTVLNRAGVPVPRYRAGVAFQDSRQRIECEAEILATADAYVAYDDTGLAYPVVGYYSTPTLQFTAARDIQTAQTQITDDGETAVDGVVVYYTDPTNGYTRQPCAPWQNPAWYDGISVPNYAQFDCLACQNHNQAVRLAKAVGTRIAATRKAVLGTTIKGILARGVRAIDLQYDATFTGPHEIVTPVEQDASGIAVAFAVVPLASDRWDLNAGEEGIPPSQPPALALTDPLADPTGVVLTTVGSQIRATFNAPARADLVFWFRYFGAPFTGPYQYFTGDMTALAGHSGPLINGASYLVSWQARSNAGKESPWTAATAIIVVSNTTAPASLAAVKESAGSGSATLTFTTANDQNQYAVAVYRGATNVFAAATLVTTVYAGPNFSGFATETGIAAGTWFLWGVPQNNSAVSGTASGPFNVTVT